MARLRPLTKDEVSPEVRAVLEQSEKSFGEPLATTGIRAYSPPILEASRMLAAAPAKSHTLPPLLRSLVCLRAAQMVGCPF
jgi:alkylhydroperoxidase family enzyme